MLCPDCQHDNLAGERVCENCAHELVERPKATGPTGGGLPAEPLRALHPKRPVFVSRDATVADTVGTMNRHGIGFVLVGEPGKVAGIFTERDLLRRVGAKIEEARERPIHEFMTEDPESLDVETPLSQALERMTTGGFRHVPVTEAGKLVGVVSLRDLLALMSKWYRDLIF